MIKFEDVSFTYSPKSPLEVEAINNVSLSIRDKSFTCIVGKTGCGKSTLIKHLNGLIIPSIGKVKVDQFTMSPKKKERSKNLQLLKKHVGIVFQFSENQLFEETIEEDVAFGPTNFGVKKEDALKIAHEALKLVGLNEDYYKKSPFEISGGEKRRVSIAGILALKPDVLVLDEPTAGLDPRGAKLMLNLFKKLNESGTTIILVTHDMNIVFEYATDVIVMQDGTVIKQSKPHELFLSDVEQYSLETPLLAKVIQKLTNKGYCLDLSKITDIDSLVSQLKECKHV